MITTFPHHYSQLNTRMRSLLLFTSLLALLLQLQQVSCFHSWTFDHACNSMAWTPTTTESSLISSIDVDLDSFDLVVIVLNTTNITSLEDSEDDIVLDDGYETIVNQALQQNETKKVLRYVGQDGTMKKVAVVERKKCASTIGGILKGEKSVESCAVVLPVSISDDFQDVATDLLGQLYTDQRYKSSKNGDNVSNCKRIEFVWPSTEEDIPLESLERAQSIASGVFLTKDIVNAPHNVLNSFALAETAQRLAKESHGALHCKILEAKDCEKRGMGAYLGVARGSETYPKFIHLTYTPKGRKSKHVRKIGIIGKGLLFDTGGYNIKTMGMEGMKFDCGGAAAVLGAAKAIAALQPPHVEVHFVIAACENMINERAMVPGDILIASNGKTIEVGNTDAEGRLTMADALVYADKELGCERIIELSTLTGACMISLGKVVAGMWTSNDELADELEAASKATGEKLWRMPLQEEYNEQLKSKIADIRNIGTRFGGAITAALFLNNFVSDDTPFAHIDIAGPVWSDKVGATGYGAKLVTEWVCQQAEKDE